MVSTTKNEAFFIAKGKIENDKFKLDCFDKEENHLIMTIHFTDSSLSEMNGNFSSFYDNGVLENEGNYVNSLEDGIWIKRDTVGLMIDSSFYEKGLKYTYAKFEYSKRKALTNYQFTDSLKNTYQYITFDSVGTKIEEANFIGDNGIYNVYDSGKVKTKNVFTRKLIEAECKSFKTHLQKTLNANVGMENGAKPGTYQVVVKFIVNKDGTISDIKAETKFGHKMEEEVIKVIMKSPEWTPASIFGIPVKAYRRQPVTFVISQDR